VSVVKPATVKPTVCLGGFNILCICTVIFVCGSIQDLHTTLPSISEFLANRHREGRPFLMAVNVITSAKQCDILNVKNCVTECTIFNIVMIENII